MNSDIISWLLEGDVSVQYQTYRDLLDTDKPDLRKKIELEGWGLRFLSLRQKNGHWGRGFYQPKWTSSHYTLLDLKNLNISPENASIKETIRIIFEKKKGFDGGIYPIGNFQKSDVCINGMALNYASYFRLNGELLKSVVDFLLAQRMQDGGFNCQSNRGGAVHSSLHSTLSVLEGITEYENSGYTYKLDELQNAKLLSQQFILIHRLFRSDRTGNIINKNFLKFPYPSRWHYDILRAMDYFRIDQVEYDTRMEEAIEVIKSKKKLSGIWNLPSNHPGQTHFNMEKPGSESRWNTLRAMRVLKYYKAEQ